MTPSLIRAAAPAALLLAAWLAPCTPALANDAAQMALGKKLLSSAKPAACAVCHTLKDAGSEGAIGPVLDELQPDAERVARALRNGIGSMPSFKDTLSEAEIAAVALYVSRASRGQ